MKISEMIKKLEEIKNLHGDVETIAYNEDNYDIEFIQKIEFGYYTNKDDGENEFYDDIKDIIEQYKDWYGHEEYAEEFKSAVNAITPVARIKANQW